MISRLCFPIRVDGRAYKAALAAAVVAVLGFSHRTAAQDGEPAKKKFFLNEDGTVELRLAKVEEKLDKIDSRLKAVEGYLSGRQTPVINATSVSLPPGGAATRVPPTWTGRNIRSQEGVWFNQMSDGSLRICEECNTSAAGVLLRTAYVAGTGDCPNGVCQTAGACGLSGCGGSSAITASTASGGGEGMTVQSTGRPRLFGRLFGRVRGGVSACGQ